MVFLGLKALKARTGNPIPLKLDYGLLLFIKNISPLNTTFILDLPS